MRWLEASLNAATYNRFTRIKIDVAEPNAKLLNLTLKFSILNRSLVVQHSI